MVQIKDIRNIIPTDFPDLLMKAIQLPGVKISRKAFLQEQFKNESSELKKAILKQGPVEANVPRSEIHDKAEHLIQQRTLLSTAASFAAGLPGGITMTAAIPADFLQFFSVALRTAQEIAYLYGEPDLWNGEALDNERVMNQMMLYSGVMFGATGAASAVRAIASKLASSAADRLPQEVLTKGIIYPVIESVASSLTLRMGKDIFSNGIAKAIPLAGGIISSGITYMTMRQMGSRLIDALDEAHFTYTAQDYDDDIEELQSISDEPYNHNDSQ